MRIGVVTPAYNDEDVIRGTIRSLKPFVDKHIVLISEKPYFGNYSEPDKTFQYCMDEEVEVIKGVWELDHYQRNLGISLCQDCDWVLTFDSDEMLTKEGMEKLIEALKETDADALVLKPKIYWNTTDYILSPDPGFMPIVAVRPNIKFIHIRNIEACKIDIYTNEDNPMHHLSWCSPKDIYKKVKCYAHAPDYDWETWYQDYYKHWDFNKDSSVIFPDGDKYEAIYKPLPKELLDLL